MDSLVVNVGMAVQQIVDVDEKKQTIIFSGWLDMVELYLLIFFTQKIYLNT
jgi:hypothetical protein